VFFTIYKTTNKINGKYYHGKHQTEILDDGYLGSGRLLQRAIKKYGSENFVKEILFIYDNEQEMNDKEKELVEIGNHTYNLCEGGKGGFSYINREVMTTEKRKIYGYINGKKTKPKREGGLKNVSLGLGIWNPIYKDKRSFWCSKAFLGKYHSESSKEKMREAKIGKYTGKKNSQYGTCWIYHPQLGNKKIDKTELKKYIELGYSKGRKIKTSQ
jgi:hypothetical protein